MWYSYKRAWDASCPRVWSEWHAEGARWTIADVDPADDEEAVNLYVEHYLPDELLLKSLNAERNEANERGGRDFWQKALAGRTSLACYRTEAEGTGVRQIVALNACTVRSIHDPPYDVAEMEGDEWRKMVAAMAVAEAKCDVFAEMGVGSYLGGSGLLVLRQWRGRGLGQKLLHAREAMCRALGVPGTATVFTGPASQREAAKCGFRTLLELTLPQLADAGLHFPISSDYTVKLMANNYT